jgi:pyruvyltransferase
MPRYYKAKPNNMRYRIGIVPHFVDQDSEIVKSLSEGPDVKVIYVQNNYDIFINEIASCDFILSSSLHGLILSDAYGIPNKWISLSDKVIGGEFKFKDYYSTTNKPEEACAYLKKTSDLLDLTSDVSSRASIKKYTGSLRRLESACSIG